jgi:hypothetical protein
MTDYITRFAGVDSKGLGLVGICGGVRDARRLVLKRSQAPCCPLTGRACQMVRAPSSLGRSSRVIKLVGGVIAGSPASLRLEIGL